MRWGSRRWMLWRIQRNYFGLWSNLLRQNLHHGQLPQNRHPRWTARHHPSSHHQHLQPSPFILRQGWVHSQGQLHRDLQWGNHRSPWWEHSQHSPDADVQETQQHQSPRGERLDHNPWDLRGEMLLLSRNDDVPGEGDPEKENGHDVDELGVIKISCHFHHLDWAALDWWFVPKEGGGCWRKASWGWWIHDG